MKNLMKSLPIVAKVLGDKYGVRVEVGGNQACTDGNTIYLPSLPDDDRKAEILARGYIDHEAAHVRFNSGLLSGSPLETGLQNILEDIRIEARMKERYRGCGGNLNRLVNELVADCCFIAPDANTHPGAVVQSFLLHRLRCDVLGQKGLSALADQSEARFHEVFSRGKATRIAALGWQAESAASINEIKALVKRILSCLQEDDEPESPQQPNNQAGDPQGGSAGDSQSDQDRAQSSTPAPGSGDSQESTDADQAQPGDLDPSGQANASGESSDSPDSSGNGSKGAGQKGCEDCTPPNAAEQAMTAESSDLLQDMAQMVGNELEKQFSNRPAADDVAISEDRSRDTHLYRDLMRPIEPHRARKATNALRSRLEGLIQSSRLQRTPPKRSGRRIDSRKLARVGRKDLRVFRSRAEKTAVNTAVHILMDRSASMTDEIAMAAEAMYASALALESIPGVAQETAVFPVGQHDVATLTPFGAKVRDEDYRVFANGGTPMAEALRHAAYRLIQQPQTRRIALVITDGAPTDAAATLALVNSMIAHGIEVFGIGIGGMQCPDLFRQYRVIHHVQELPKALFGLLEQPLMAQSA